MVKDKELQESARKAAKELQERNRKAAIEFLRLLEKDPKNKFGDKAKAEAFIHGAMYSLNEELERMLNEGIDVNVCDENNVTVIMVTTDIRTVRLLLSRGADPNIKNNKGRNALFCILYSYFPKRQIMPVIKALLEAGVDTTCISDGDKKTALDLFSERYNDEGVYQLLQHKYDEQKSLKYD